MEILFEFLTLNLNLKTKNTDNILQQFPLYDEEEVEQSVMYKFAPEAEKFHITRGDDGVYIVTGAHIEKIFHQTDFNREASVMRFARQLRHAGVDQALRDLGVQDGDLVRILNFEFEFKD